MKTIDIIVLTAVILLVLFLSFVVVAAVYVARVLAWPKHFTTAETVKIEKGKNLYFNYDELDKEEFDTKSYDGYVLKGTCVVNDPKKFVIISHGYTYTRIGGLKYLHMFYNHGYSCILFDQRGHGENEKFKCTMGFNESRDLIEVINHVYQKFGNDITLGLHGESMGAGTQITALKYHPKLDFIVNDCGYGVYRDVIESQAKKLAHIPSWIVALAGKFSKVLYGYNFCKFRPVDSLEENTVPILFIHGGNDNLVKCRQSRLMYDADPGEKQIHIFKDSRHAQSFQDYPEQYDKLVSDFLKHLKERNN